MKSFNVILLALIVILSLATVVESQFGYYGSGFGYRPYGYGFNRGFYGGGFRRGFYGGFPRYGGFYG